MNPHYSVVSERADHRCEYCHAPESVFNFPFEVEHIIPVSLEGTSAKENLALACRSCNLRKGSRTSGNAPVSSDEVRFFHPRKDKWCEHFHAICDSGRITGTTTIGEVTIKYLEMNSVAQVKARSLWILLGLFP